MEDSLGFANGTPSAGDYFDLSSEVIQLCLNGLLQIRMKNMLRNYILQ